MASPLHQRLRDATRAEHERLERRIDILTEAATPAGRRGIVLRFHRMHAEAEAALAPWLADLPGLNFGERRRTPRLDRDLAALGVRPAPSIARLNVGSLGEALGRMYVLEGSTLGGRVVRKALESAGQGLEGLSFLDPYGAQQGERWRSFLAVLDAASADADAVAAGAVAGFHHAEATLCGEAADV